MISKEDYQVITFLDSADDKQKAVFLQENSAQCANTFYHLLGHISKDQTLQYVLVMINDLLQASFSKFYTPSLCNHGDLKNGVGNVSGHQVMQITNFETGANLKFFVLRMRQLSLKGHFFRSP